MPAHPAPGVEARIDVFVCAKRKAKTARAGSKKIPSGILLRGLLVGAQITKCYNSSMEYRSRADLKRQVVSPQDPPETPTFPFVMFMFALVKDTLDLIMTMTGVGIFILMPISLMSALLITVWALARGSMMSAAKWKARAKKKMWLRWIFETLGENTPILDMIPWTTWFVWSTYRDEKKAYEKQLAAYEGVGEFA